MIHEPQRPIHPRLLSLQYAPVLVTRPLPRAGHGPALKQDVEPYLPPTQSVVSCYQEPPQDAAVAQLATESIFGAALATAYQQVLKLREQNSADTNTMQEEPF